MPAKINESIVTQKDPEKITRELAVKKVEKVMEEMKKRLPMWICGADTIIAIDDKTFGKPKNREEASAMLKEFSGKQHKAITSIAIFRGHDKNIDCRSVSCTVTFAELNEEDINWYLDTNEWQGVAGAYRIQGLASCLISKIEGSPTTVVGLPLREFYVMLRDNGYPYGS